MSYYDKCFVMGTGQFAFNCASYLQSIFHVENVFEYGNLLQSRLEILCNKGGIPYARLLDQEACYTLMCEIMRNNKKTLIVSASNVYIFPKFVTDSDNIDIINYHPALLAKHIGRNTEAWAIYNQDCITGVTWHRVTDEIDHGLILTDENIELDNNITSVKLMLQQYQLGFKLFTNIINQVLNNEINHGKKIYNYGQMHYSYERPNNGILDLSWSLTKISAFLRSMDYGSLHVMGFPIMIENGVRFSWDSYRILKTINKCQIDSNSKLISKEDQYIVLQNYHKIENS